jgi:hypothetical protein
MIRIARGKGRRLQAVEFALSPQKGKKEYAITCLCLLEKLRSFRHALNYGDMERTARLAKAAGDAVGCMCGKALIVGTDAWRDGRLHDREIV